MSTGPLAIIRMLFVATACARQPRVKTQAQWRRAVPPGLQRWGGQRELRYLGYAGLVCFLLASGLTRHAAAQSCTNYACFQVSCLGGATTSVSYTHLLEITPLNSTAIPDPVQKLFIFVAERRAFQQVRTVT